MTDWAVRPSLWGRRDGALPLSESEPFGSPGVAISHKVCAADTERPFFQQMAADGRTFDNRAAPYTANGNYAKIPICDEGTAPSSAVSCQVIK